MASYWQSFLNIAAACTGTNHFWCLLTPLGGGTLLKAQIDRSTAAHYRHLSATNTSAASLLRLLSYLDLLVRRRLFDAHRALDLGCHTYFVLLWASKLRASCLAGDKPSDDDVSKGKETSRMVSEKKKRWPVVVVAMLLAAHVASFLSHGSRYFGYPIEAYEAARVTLLGTVIRVEYWVDCCSQPLSMAILLGGRQTFLSFVAQYAFRLVMMAGLDLKRVEAASPHNAANFICS